MNRLNSVNIVTLLDRVFLFVSLLAIASLVIEYGFYLSASEKVFLHRIDILIIWYFVLQSLLKLIITNKKRDYLKTHWFNYLIVLFVISQTALFIREFDLVLLGKFLSGDDAVQITKFYIIAFQLSIVLSFFTQGTRLSQKLASYRFHPAQVLMGSFLVIIVIGTALLLLPKAVQPGKHLSFLDALFTSTSATCVTGLIVVDTGHHFSRMGQIIIMVLYQIGGLGFMTYASFFTLLLRRRISLREKSMLQEMLNYENIGIISRLLITSVIFTFVMEAVGTVLFYQGFAQMHPEAGERLFSAIFHSISAFCNAGFSTYSDSFVQFSGNYLVIITSIFLIVLGGLGFPVILNLFKLPILNAGRNRNWLNVQSRLVIGISGILLTAGFIFFLIAENSLTLAGFGWPKKILNALFQSVTTRTAGFNTVDIGLISTPTVIFFLFLMFIGASPGSTGGGIKTTTFGVLFAGVWSVIRGKNRVELFRKNIPFTVFNRAVVILFFSMIFIFLIVLALTISENLSLLDILFETFSAFGTVGLSRGITPMLSSAGKVAIILAMYFGRLGALTISLAITMPRETSHYDYPSENVMVG